MNSSQGQKGSESLLEAAKSALHAWEIWAGAQPQNDDIESLEWGEFNRLRNAITREEGR